MSEHHGDDDELSGQLRERFDGMVVESPPNALADSIVSTFVQGHRVDHPLARAVLAADGGLTGPAPAFRSAADGSGALHVVYRADAVHDASPSEIALSVYGGAVNDVLVGQVFHADHADHADEADRTEEADPSMVVEVLQSTRLVAVSPVGPAGEFSVEVPAGWTELVLVTADAEVTVPAPTTPRREWA